jgi:hypothetical protein
MTHRASSVYYRLRPLEETLVAKTHMPLALDPARLARLRKWFFDAPIAVTKLPDYSPKTATNPSSPSGRCRWTRATASCSMTPSSR